MKNREIKKYLHKAKRFSAYGELYQGIPGGSGPYTRDLEDRWEAYRIDAMDLKGKSIVDLGCNIGGFSLFCKSYCKSYLGIDVDPDSIALAQELFQFPNCTFEVGKFCELYGTFDIILALAVRRYTGLSFHDFAEKCDVLLNKGGKIFFESHGREKWTPNVKKAFEKFFTIQRVGHVPSTSLPDCKNQRFFVEMEKK